MHSPGDGGMLVVCAVGCLAARNKGAMHTEAITPHTNAGSALEFLSDEPSIDYTHAYQLKQ